MGAQRAELAVGADDLQVVDVAELGDDGVDRPGRQPPVRATAGDRAGGNEQRG